MAVSSWDIDCTYTCTYGISILTKATKFLFFGSYLVAFPRNIPWINSSYICIDIFPNLNTICFTLFDCVSWISLFYFRLISTRGFYEASEPVGTTPRGTDEKRFGNVWICPTPETSTLGSEFPARKSRISRLCFKWGNVAFSAKF